MSPYVDGFVIPLRKDKVEEYRRIAEISKAVWLDHGALDYRECIGDDLDSEFGVSFLKIANCSPEETVVFAWITYTSREQRDEINAKVMQDPRMKDLMDQENPLFECKRMSYGGFQTIVQA